MNRNKAFELLFEYELNHHDTYGGWDYYYNVGEKVTVSICPSAIAIMPGGDEYKYEYVFDKNNKLLGIQEEFTLNVDFNTMYWFFIYEDKNREIKTLYHNKDGEIKLIRKFYGSSDADEGKWTNLKNPNELKIEWYDKKNKSHTDVFYPDGSSKKLSIKRKLGMFRGRT